MVKSSQYLPSFVLEDFKTREQKALECIRNSGLKYTEVGIFGSYARDEFIANSDIDFLMIIEDDAYVKRLAINLRDVLEDIKCDIVYVNSYVYSTSDKLFYRRTRKEYIRKL